MTYFISGHRNLSYEDFEKYYIPTIKNIIDFDNYPVFVMGDYEGVDKFAMDYIYNQTFCEIIIYHMGNNPKNVPENIDKERPTIIDDIHTLENKCGFLVSYSGGYKSDEERDAAMTKISDCDIAFIKDNRWNSGTAQNIKRRHSII